MTIAPEGIRATAIASTEAEREHQAKHEHHVKREHQAESEAAAVLAQHRDHDPETELRAERMLVALLPQVVKELRLLEDRTGLSRTDITNRAITLYEFIDQQQLAGREILIRDRCTGDMHNVQIQ